MRTSPLLSNAAWLLAGNTCYAVCQWGMLVALAKLGGPHMVGEFALGLATASPLFLFANLQLRPIAVTDVRNEHSFGDYLGLRLATTAIALAIAAILARIYGAEAGWVLLAIATAKAFESISDLLHGDLQRREWMRRIALWLILKGIASVVAVAVVLRLTNSTAAGAAAMAAVFGAVLLGGEMRTAPAGFHPRWRTATVKRLIRVAVPMGAVTMLISLSANIPRYFMERARGASELGIFAALAYLTMAGSTLINALGQSAVPRLSAMHAAGDLGEFRKLLRRLLGIGALVGAGGVAVFALFGKPVLTLLYRPEFAAHGSLALWVMVG
jgi:O-antigen/teichoic acid export membrane protein